MTLPARAAGQGRVASLGMYDFPWLAAANDALWSAIARRLAETGLRGVPAALDRSRPVPDIWRDPALLLGQTCGFPLVRTLAGRVRVVATPCYDFPGCDGIWHRSFLVARAGDGLRGRAEPAGLAELRGRRCAYNGPDSNSGMNLLRATLAPIARGAPMLGGLIETGAHLNSLAAVRDGAADFAAIDCVSHAFVARARPELVRGLCVLAWTPASPALPLITGAGTTDAEFAALRQVIADPGLRPLWRALGVRALAFTAFDTYAPVTALARAAAESLYPELA